MDERSQGTLTEPRKGLTMQYTNNAPHRIKLLSLLSHFELIRYKTTFSV